MTYMLYTFMSEYHERPKSLDDLYQGIGARWARMEIESPAPKRGNLMDLLTGR